MNKNALQSQEVLKMYSFDCSANRFYDRQGLRCDAEVFHYSNIPVDCFDPKFHSIIFVNIQIREKQNAQQSKLKNSAM